MYSEFSFPYTASHPALHIRYNKGDVAGRPGAAAETGCQASRGVMHLGCGWLQCLLCTAGADASGLVRLPAAKLHTSEPLTY
jgi:hypothetical protein